MLKGVDEFWSLLAYYLAGESISEILTIRHIQTGFVNQVRR
jgi:hypothetical protein